MTTFTIPVTGPGTVTLDVNFVPQVVVPPASGWVYHAGKFLWGGDYDFSAVSVYADTSLGITCLKITSQAWGGWLPYANGTPPAFDSTPYTKLTFALRPTAANQKWHVYFVKQGDIPVGINISVDQLAKYGPAPQVGVWGTYTVPLADLGVLGTSIYKFAIQDQTGLANNIWYVNDVGFVA